MKRDVKTKGQFTKEASALQRRLDELEAQVTEYKKAQKALKASEHWYREIVRNLPQRMFIKDRDLKYLACNINVATGHGIEPEEIVGKTDYELYPKEFAEKYRTDDRRIMASGKSEVIEESFILEGEERFILTTKTPLRDRRGNIIGLLGTSTDITELRRTKEEIRATNEELQAAEEELRTANEELQVTVEELRHGIAQRIQAEEKIKQAAEEWRTTFDAITDWVSIHGKDFTISRVNKAFADALKTEPVKLVGKSCCEMVHGASEPLPNCPHLRTLETKVPANLEFFEPHLGVYLEVTTSPIFNEKGEVIASVHVARDVTERKRIDEQLVITDRLASVGELASGIAHELNNPLTSIIGFSQLLLEKDAPDDVKEDVRIISSEAQRAASVVKNLLTFARKHAPAKQLVNINGIIEKVLELRAYEQKVNNIRVNTQLAAYLPEIMGDYFQLQQVFLNIIINAEYFMIEANKRGTLTIATERVNNMVKASFADNGPGIPEENLRYLFNPFFTTKEVGKGTGLGLSICHGIISGHGGRIYAESEAGKGATFIVELPISAADRGEEE